MEITGTLEQRAARAARVNEDSYTDQLDGLLHCSRCGGALQKRAKVLDEEKIVPCVCPCRDQTPDNEKERRQRLREAAGVSPLCVFDRAERTEQIARCRKYAANWGEASKDGAGLLLWGNVGCGKTFAAQCVANAVIDAGDAVCVKSFPEIIKYSFEENGAFLRRVRGVPLLVLDDLGAERASDFAAEAVYSVIDERTRANKPLIITTNLTIDEMSKNPDMQHKRIYDRILWKCLPIYFSGNSRREKDAAAMLDKWQKILV